MKTHHLFFLFLLISCQKPKSESLATTAIQEQKKEEIVIKENFLKTDTISISEYDEISKNNYILAHLLNQKADKDSIVTVKYQLDFYQNKSKIASSKITIKGYDKGSEFYAALGLNRETAKNSPFIQVDFGYPACGYVHQNYLYYLKNNDLQLVHQWSAMSDSGWGSWVEFVNPSSKTDPESFYCKTVSYEPEEDNDEMGTVSHSDSIVFRLSGNRWKKQLLSVKDKVYFEKKVDFNKFHSQE
jgi:hypothetical protein